MTPSTKQIAKHFRDVHFGGNWTSVNLKDTLADVNWKQATTKVQDLNTIAVLVFHVNYYVAAILKVMQGGPLDAHDKFSFDLPPISSEAEWQALKEKTFSEAEQLALMIAQLKDEKLYDDFADPKYGSYYRNLLGVIEHTHYHLGQIALIKKLSGTSLPL
ncbi:DinB family protein [Chitinophaga vietnamensis]|uniref:DinB family protein n=1 Tax=Chitinophaga vietnamensis TaxID=2593957 RepID=UPI001178549C|nr:DinB family protein [Chitinophaga vietnamensis]